MPFLELELLQSTDQLYTDTFTFSVGSTVKKPIRYRESIEDDERAGRGDEGAGQLAWRPVSLLDPLLKTTFANLRIDLWLRVKYLEKKA